MTRTDHITLPARDLKRLFESFLADDENGVGPRCTVYVDEYGAHCVEASPEVVEAQLHAVDRVVAAMLVKPFLHRARDAGGSILILRCDAGQGRKRGLTILPLDGLG